MEDAYSQRLVSTANISPRFYNWEWWTNLFYVHLYRHSFLKWEVLHPGIKLVDKYIFLQCSKNGPFNLSNIEDSIQSHSKVAIFWWCCLISLSQCIWLRKEKKRCIFLGFWWSSPFQKSIWFEYLCRPQHASIIIAQHKDHKMHPRTKVTIQIIKRGIRTIFVQIHLACFLVESQTVYQRGK